MRDISLALTLVLTLACDSSDRTRVVLPPGGTMIDSTGAAKRQFLGDSLVIVAQAGGQDERDTTFLDPYLMTASGDQVFIVEGDQRILAYDTLGHRLWSAGRNGSGPGEYRNIRDIKVAPGREVWVNDPANSRISRLAFDGTLIGVISLQNVGHSEAMIPGASATATVLPAYADADILTVDTAGQVVDRDTVPWTGYHDLDNLSRQFRTANDPEAGRWAMGFVYGNGWFAFDSHGGSARRYYIEPTRFPPVVKDVSNGGQTVSTKLVRGDLSAAAISLRADTVFVLFGGKEKSREKLDLYDWGTGNYLGSIAFPEKIDDMAVAGSFTYTMSLNPAPRLTIYRRVARP